MASRPFALREGERLAGHTSLKIGGPADYFALVRSKDELVEVLQWADAEGMPVRAVGGGTNLLVAEAGVDGLVVKLGGSEMRVEERDGESVLVADAGATIANLSRRLAKQGYGGIEWAANVPGTVGGAAVNNAGAFGGETANDLIAVTVVEPRGETRRLTADALAYEYRTSRLKRRELGPAVVVEVEFRLRRTDPAEAQALVAQFQQQRTRTQPRTLSAGSVFANPPGDYSGRLIEAAGLKGFQVGRAQVSPQHANFIVNLGGATAEDVYQLMRHVQRTVHERSGVWLRPEIELFGRWEAEERAALLGPEAPDGSGGGA